MRASAAERFAGAPLPSESEEIWRYSRVDELDLEAYAPLTEPSPPAPAGALAGRLQAMIDSLGAAAVVVGSSPGPAPGGQAPAPGVQVDEPAGESWPLGEVAGAPDAFTDLNTAHALRPRRVRISRSADPGTTVVVVNWLGADGAAYFPRLLVDVEAGADASVVEVTASDDVASLVVPVTELAVAAGGRLRYTSVQLLGPRAWQIGLQASRVERDATLTSTSVALGGDYARVRTDSALVGKGATGRLLAVWFAAGHQMPDLRTVQDHRAPHTTSELVFKGAVAGEAHSVYTGVIRVEKGAGGTNAMQTNRNLVLNEGAHADSVPNLEIEDNDVRCSHASAVGPIDEDQRFYLESRGVPTETAERLITLGFLDDVLARLPQAGLADWLRLEMAGRLEATGAGAGDRAAAGASASGAGR